LKAHIGLDRESGLFHTLVTTAANVSDIIQTVALLHGQEQEAWLDAGYMRCSLQNFKIALFGKYLETQRVKKFVRSPWGSFPPLLGDAM
jgi:hypothetical protein